jgi:Transposase DDE domain
MTTKLSAALTERLSAHIALSNSRLETLALLITGMIGARTVNLSHIASERGAPVKVASSYRRFQRFFQYVTPKEDWAARLIVALLGLTGRWTLCLDRTNWKIGTKDVNILMLAVITRRHRVPLMWHLIDGAGSSSTAQRIELMERYLALFGAASIKTLLADREFIGSEWLHFLEKNSVPFVIRVKERMTVITEDGRRFALASLLRRDRGKRTFRAALPGDGKTGPLWLGFAARRIKGGELLIVAASKDAHHALTAYRKRWSIECLFADTKTRGLNIEDTRLTIARKLSLLLAIVAIALAWSSKTAAKIIGTRPMPRKKHGYLAKSWFRTGFDTLRNRLRHDPLAAIEPWCQMNSRKTKSARVV